MGTIFSIVGVIVLLIIGMIVIALIVLTALGAMHQHLKNKGEAFGNGVTPEQLQEEINAAISANHSEHVNSRRVN